MARLSTYSKVVALCLKPDITLSFPARLLGGGGPHRLLKTQKPWKRGGFACEETEWAETL